MKKILIKIDAEKKGHVSLDVFSSILALHKVILTQESLQKLYRACREQG